MEHQYKVGQDVFISITYPRGLGRHITQHGFKSGDRCKIMFGPDVDGDYVLMNRNGWKQYVNPTDFRPANDDLRALRDDEEYKSLNHTEQAI